MGQTFRSSWGKQMDFMILTALAMIRWDRVQAELEKEVAIGTKPASELEKLIMLREELDAVMSEGETYFTSFEEEVEFSAQLMRYVLKKGR